jgi:hypothetical protein
LELMADRKGEAEPMWDKSFFKIERKEERG